jgi:hypothetical protein
MHLKGLPGSGDEGRFMAGIYKPQFSGHKIKYTLKGRDALVMFSWPDGKKPLEQIAKLEKALETISRIPDEADPFAVTPDDLPETAPIHADDWISQPLPIGKLSTEMSYELSAFGTVDFSGATGIEVIFDAPVERPVGFVTLRVDSLDKENIVATFDVQGAYPASHRAVGEVTIKADLDGKLSGNHKLFFLLSECSHCELKRWRLIYA